MGEGGRGVALFLSSGSRRGRSSSSLSRFLFPRDGIFPPNTRDAPKECGQAFSYGKESFVTWEWPQPPWHLEKHTRQRCCFFTFLFLLFPFVCMYSAWLHPFGGIFFLFRQRILHTRCFSFFDGYLFFFSTRFALRASLLASMYLSLCPHGIIIILPLSLAFSHFGRRRLDYGLEETMKESSMCDTMGHKREKQRKR